MPFRSVYLGLIIDEDSSPQAVVEYAISFCGREKAHLAARLAVPIMDLPTGRIVPMVHGLLDQVNAEHLSKAKIESERIATSARLAGILSSCDIVQKDYSDTRDDMIRAARVSDLVILPKPNGMLSLEQGIVEGILFGSGRPVLAVPADWTRGPIFNRIVVAWDGGQRAARAVGDALPFLVKAEEVEIVCIGPEPNKNVVGVGLAQHLARHCGELKLTDLATQFGDVGMTLRDHISTVTPDLVVMGAYAHSRLLQFVLGGVTSTMLSDATTPVLYSH